MRKFRAAALILFLFAPAGAAAQAPPADPAFADRLPRAWCGIFRWEGDLREQHVTIAFARVAVRAGGNIEAEGPGLVRYQDEPPSQAVPFRIRAVIEPATRRIEMFESIETPRVDYVTDGSHVGVLADDLQSLRSVWTTRGTGRRGTLQMNGRPAHADLRQGCAPPSSEAPSLPRHNSLTLLARASDPATFAMN